MATLKEIIESRKSSHLESFEALVERVYQGSLEQITAFDDAYTSFCATLQENPRAERTKASAEPTETEKKKLDGETYKKLRNRKWSHKRIAANYECTSRQLSGFSGSYNRYVLGISHTGKPFQAKQGVKGKKVTDTRPLLTLPLYCTAVQNGWDIDKIKQEYRLRTPNSLTGFRVQYFNLTKTGKPIPQNQGEGSPEEAQKPILDDSRVYIELRRQYTPEQIWAQRRSGNRYQKHNFEKSYQRAFKREQSETPAALPSTSETVTDNPLS